MLLLLIEDSQVALEDLADLEALLPYMEEGQFGQEVHELGAVPVMPGSSVKLLGKKDAGLEWMKVEDEVLLQAGQEVQAVSWGGLVEVLWEGQKEDLEEGQTEDLVEGQKEDLVEGQEVDQRVDHSEAHCKGSH